MAQEDKLIEDVKRDRESGTPGEWRHDGYNGAMAYGSVDTISCAVLGRVATAESTGASSDGEGRELYMRGDTYANARRIARVPDMEARILADAEEIRKLREALTEIRDRHMPSEPMMWAQNEYAWAVRQYRELRRIADAALISQD